MLPLFNLPWNEAPTISVDVETTGIAREDRAVQIGLARFERGALVDSFCALVNPFRPIPEEATKIHGITDDMVVGKPTIEEVFASERVKALVAGAQPLAFNAMYDRFKVPTFTEPAEWPFLDPIVMVRDVDKWVRGSQRNKLAAACARHGIANAKEHDAGADAIAAGQLFYVLAPKWIRLLGGAEDETPTLGQFITAQRHAEARQWGDFWTFRANAPPKEEIQSDAAAGAE